MRSFNLADLFEVAVDSVPDRLALVAGDRRLTYRELDERANRVADHLDREGVAAGDWVGILSWNRAEWIESMLGIYKRRAVPVNLNYRYVAEELRYILDDAGVVTLLGEPDLLAVVEPLRSDLPSLRNVLAFGEDYESALAAASPERRFAPRSADDLYVLYTGGTTGMPKGVLWRSEDIFFAALGGGGFGQPPIQHADELAERVAAGGGTGVTLVNAPMMHGGGQWMTFIALFGGNTVVLWSERGWDADAMWRLAEREGVNTILVVGDAMARPIAEALAAPGSTYDTSSVVVVGSGGAILSNAVKQQLRDQLPNTFVLDSFGASETGAAGSVLEQDAGQPVRFAMGDAVAVLDEDLRRVEPGSGVVGRLARSGHIPLGYHKDPEKTTETFVTDGEGRRWVLPGDMATVESDGSMTLLGRGSQCINTGGEKVFPDEVEAALKSHEDVYDVVVVGIPDERYVERVAAIVQPRAGAAPSLDDLQAYCRTKVAGYKVPRTLRLTDAIPRTAVGKPDYRAARALAADENTF